MKQLLGTVIANVALAPGTHLLMAREAAIAQHAIAGQFVHVRCGSTADPLLRRPVSITRVPPASVEIGEEHGAGVAGDSVFGLRIEDVGKGPALLPAAKPADQLDLLGPLGRGFRIHEKTRRILLVAGGVGIAPLLALAREALANDVSVTLLGGARTAAKVFPPALVPAEVEYVVLTDDGSMGGRGLVTSVLPDFKDWADQVFACGPEPMLRALAVGLSALPMGANARSRRPSRDKVSAIPWAQVSLEQRMGCAMGACYGCALETSGGRRRVCRDGPVFDCFEVEWC